MKKREDTWAFIGVLFILGLVISVFYSLYFKEIYFSPESVFYECTDCEGFYGMKIESIIGNSNEISIITTGAVYNLNRTRMEMWRRIDPEINDYNPKKIAELNFDRDLGSLVFVSGDDLNATIKSDKASFIFYSDSLFIINASQTFKYTHKHLGNSEWNKTISSQTKNKYWAGPDGGSLHARIEGSYNLGTLNGVPAFDMRQNHTNIHMVFPSKLFDFERLYGENSRPFIHYVSGPGTMSQLLEGCINNVCPNLDTYKNAGFGVFMLGAVNYDHDESISSLAILNTSETPRLLDSGYMGYQFKDDLLVRNFIEVAHANGFKVIPYITSPTFSPRWIYPEGHELAGQMQPVNLTLRWLRNFRWDYNFDGWFFDGFVTGGTLENYQDMKKVREDLIKDAGEGAIIRLHHSSDG